MSRQIEFIGINTPAENWLLANSAVAIDNVSNAYFDTFNKRYDLRVWQVGPNIWMEKVQQELQFPKPYLFTQLVRQDDPTIVQNPWAIVTVGLSDSRQTFNKFFGQIFTS